MGETISLETLWDLSKRWYRGYFESTWSRKTAAEAKAVFDKCGLTSAFWSLDEDFK